MAQDMQDQATPGQSETAQNSVTQAPRGLPSITNIQPDADGQQRRKAPVSKSKKRTKARNTSALSDGRRILPLEEGEEEEVEKSSFETYVEAVTGSELPLFGKNLFNDEQMRFDEPPDGGVNADYLVGPGDEIEIRGWGMIDVSVNVKVDRGGQIYVPKVGTISVAGVKYRDLQGHLKQAVSKIFNNFELTASISQTRSVQVYVVGHAVRPGTYTLSSMSTLMNALFIAGGPDGVGSMRNIQLKRGGKTVTAFDLYDVLVKGDKTKDVALSDGDVVFIPEVGPLVALSGNVKQPGIFEMNGASSLADLVTWAGGVEPAAEQKQIIVEKTVANKYETIAELVADEPSMQAGFSSIPLKPADVVRVFAPGAVGLRAAVQHEYVRVSGEVKQTGVVKIRKNETMRELLSRLGGNTENGYIYGAELRRERLRRTQQLKLNELADRFERDIESAATARLAGTADKDAVAIQAAELERQRRVAERLRTVKAEGRIVLELADASAQVKNLPDVNLEDGDSIYVPRRPGTVEVMGSVFQSNSMIFKPHRKINDYIDMAGGTTPSADTSAIYVIRADGTAKSMPSGWLRSFSSASVNPGDTIVVPETIDRGSFRQSLKEWTAIFYQFGLGAAGLKVLRD